MNTPAEIAREALRELATRRKPPTPDNYAALYREISGEPEATVAAAATPPAGAAAPSQSLIDAAESAPGLQSLLTQVLDSFRLLIGRDPALCDDLDAFARETRSPVSRELVEGLTERMGTLQPRLRHAATTNEALHDGLVRLLQMMLRTARDMASDNEALDHLMGTLESLLQREIDLHTVEQAEQRLRDVLVKHGVLKQGLEDVKNTLKEMVSSFIDRLGEMSTNTGDYHDKLARYATQIESTRDVNALNRVLQELMRETRLMQAGADNSRRQLLAARENVEATQARIRSLENDLARATQKMREDSLTGMVNRYGLEDDFEREAARSDAEGRPFCVALLDVDNFKQLNDVHGHQGGDQALVYLASVMRETVRKSDIVVRYGGEEFLILLPDTALDAAQALVVRVQRALTRHLFLHNNERVLITFSCGVGQRQPGEGRDALLHRVDEAMYRAKRAGKNRVYTATDGPETLAA